MKKLLFVLAFVSVLFQSCAVSPVPDADDPRTLYLVQVSMTYGNEGSGNYIAETVNRSAISSAIESLFDDGHTDFDEMEAVIFDEVRGSYYLSASAALPEESGKWTLEGDIIPKFESISDRADQNDLLVIFICGHGRDDGALCFYNPDAENGMDYLLPEDFISLMAGIECNKLALLLTCFSGTVADLGDGAMSNGMIINEDMNAGFSAEFSIAKALSDSLAKQFGSSGSGNGKLWMITAAQHDQESFSFNYTDADGMKMTWDPFVDYAAQSFGYDPVNDSFSITGSDRLSVMDICRNIARLYKLPIVDAAASMPDEMRNAFIIYGMEDEPLERSQVLDYVLTGVDLVLF